MAFVRFYWQWLATAFTHAFGVADLVSSVLGLALPPLVRFTALSRHEVLVNDLAWQMPLALLGTLFLARIALAPYWMHQEQVKKTRTVEDERDSARTLADRLGQSASDLLERQINRGEKLLRTMPRDFYGGPEGWITGVESWNAETMALLRGHYSPKDVGAFQNAPIGSCTTKDAREWSWYNDDLGKRLDEAWPLLKVRIDALWAISQGKAA